MIQYFHYHPILGLQYFTSEPVMIDLAQVPKNFSSEDFLRIAKQTGIMIIDSCKKEVTEIRKIIHNLYV